MECNKKEEEDAAMKINFLKTMVINPVKFPNKVYLKIDETDDGDMETAQLRAIVLNSEFGKFSADVINVTDIPKKKNNIYLDGNNNGAIVRMALVGYNSMLFGCKDLSDNDTPDAKLRNLLEGKIYVNKQEYESDLFNTTMQLMGNMMVDVSDIDPHELELIMEALKEADIA